MVAKWRSGSNNEQRNQRESGAPAKLYQRIISNALSGIAKQRQHHAYQQASVMA